MTTHSSADHVIDDTIVICPPTTWYDTSSAKCFLCKLIVFIIFNIAKESYYRPNNQGTKRWDLQNVQAYYGMLTMMGWINIISTNSASLRWWFYLDNIAYVGGTKPSPYNVGKITVKMQANLASGNSIWNTHEVDFGTWHFGAISYGNYMDANFLMDDVSHINPENGTLMTTSGGNSYYIRVGYSNLVSYIKDVAIIREYLSINELKKLMYKTPQAAWIDPSMYTLYDLRKYGWNAVSNNDQMSHLRCSQGALMSYNQKYCMLKGELAVTNQLSLPSTYIGVNNQATFELIFKVKDWASGDIILMSFGNILKVKILGSTHKIGVLGKNEEGVYVVNVTSTKAISLNEQTHLVVTIDDIWLKLYFNKESEKYIIVLCYIYYIYIGF